MNDYDDEDDTFMLSNIAIRNWGNEGGSIHIPVRDFADELSCPICFCPFKQCLTTLCGHNFCTTCINDCIKHGRVCPICKQDIPNMPNSTEPLLIRNFQVDNLISLMDRERKKAADSYADKLLHEQQPVNEQFIKEEQIVQEQQQKEHRDFLVAKQELERIFRQHVDKSMVAFQHYLKQMHDKYDYGRTLVRQDYLRAAREHIQKTGARSDDIKLIQMRQQCEQRCAQLNVDLNKSVKGLLTDYDKFMSEFAPSPLVLPLDLQVTIEHSGKKIPIMLHAIATLEDLKKKLIEKYKETQNQSIADFNSNSFYLRLGQDELVPIADAHRPLAQYGVTLVDNNIIVKGNIAVRNELQCYTITCNNGVNSQDYYYCNDCKLNWICTNCLTCCHSGHNTKVFMRGQPRGAKTTVMCGCASSKRTCEINHRHGESREEHQGMHCQICTDFRAKY